MKKTTGDIYLNIEDSDYITIVDRVDRIELYFTSMFYKNKFEKMMNSYIETENYKLKNKYGFDCGELLDTYLILSLYRKIEKRGFKVYVNSIRINENYFKVK